MKNSTVLFIIGLLVIAAGLAWIIGGEMTGPAKTGIPQTTATMAPPATVPVTTMVVPLTTAPATAVSSPVLTTATTIVTATTAPVSGNDIRDMFLDVAYTSTSRLERINYSATKPRVVIATVSAGDDDIALIEKIALDFNNASTTVKLSENIKETGTGDLLIKFLPADGLRAIDLDAAPETGPFSEVLTRRELYQGGVPAAKILRGTIYINANLKGDARRHVLVRSLMYELGLTGETTKFPDSVFYAAENTNADLTPVDKKVIAMLYAQGFENGMTMEELRKVVYLP